MTMSNITFNTIAASNGNRGWISANKLNVYDSIYSNLIFYNDYEFQTNLWGIFGVQYSVQETSSDASGSDIWRFENIIFDTIFTNEMPILYFSADSLTTTTIVKLYNVYFNNIECFTSDASRMPMIGGYGGVLNGLTWDMDGIYVNNAITEMFLYLSAKNDAVMKNFIYNTQRFDSGLIGYDDNSIIIYVDSTASLEIELNKDYILCTPILV